MDAQDRERYSRQIRLAQLGEAGQQRLLDSRALIVGMGGLGSPAAMYLAAAGVGHLAICDFDRVEPSNLQRQIIHRSTDIGEPKAFSALATLEALNPRCQVTALDWQLDDAELLDEVRRAQVVLDCSDNFATRFALNRACAEAGTALVCGAAIRMEGQIITLFPGAADSPCYQCLSPAELEATETCALEGVLAPLVGVIGSLQAAQAVMVLVGLGETLKGKLLLLDLVAMAWQEIRVPKNPECPLCRQRV